MAASTLCDRFEQVASVSDPSFPKVMPALIAANNVDFYVAIIDEEIAHVADWQTQNCLLDVRTNAPRSFAARLCLDKLRTHTWLLENGFPSPSTSLPSDAKWTGAPMLVKPRSGRGSMGVRTLNSKPELDELAQGDSVVIQELCTAPEVTIDVFRSLSGNVLAAVCRERLEVKAGVCTKARVFRDSDLEVLGCSIAEGLGLHGAVCIQAMRCGTEAQWCVTDVNPRPGAGTPLSGAAGFDALGAMVADGLELGGVPELLSGFPDGERFVVRHFEEVLLAR